MTRREAVAALAAAAALIVAALVWLAGPWGLLAGGAGIAALVLFGVDIEERGREREAVADAARSPGVPAGR